MKIVNFSLYSFFTLQKLSTFFLVFSLFGYQFLTSVFASLAGDISTIISTPFRAVMFLLAIVLILYSPPSKNSQENKELFFFFIVLSIYILKVLFDLYYYDADKALFLYSRTLKYQWFIIIPGVFALRSSYRYIDFSLAFKMSSVLCFLGILFAYYNMGYIYGEDVGGRMRIGDSIELLNSISLGHFGGTGALIGVLEWGKKHDKSFFYKMYIVFYIYLGVTVLIRSCSRGPFVSLIVCIFFYYIAKNKNKQFVFVLASLSLLFLFYYNDELIQLIGNISPLLADRLYSTKIEGDEARNALANLAMQQFLDYPFGGGYFMIPYYGYSHNIILDAFMTFGVWAVFFVAMLIMALKKAYHLMSESIAQYQWIALIFFQLLIAAMFSGTFYNNFPLIATIMLLFTIDPTKINKDDCNVHS